MGGLEAKEVEVEVGIRLLERHCTGLPTGMASSRLHVPNLLHGA